MCVHVWMYMIVHVHTTCMYMYLSYSATCNSPQFAARAARALPHCWSSTGAADRHQVQSGRGQASSGGRG